MIDAFVGCSVLAFVTWKTDVLSAKASILAFLMGLTIWALNGPLWILLLVSFLVIGYGGTKWKFDYKRGIGTEESKNGRRNIVNILGNGTAPVVFAVVGSPVAFAGSISTALADTLASEIGVVSDRSRLITTWKKVEPGTNGAVSPLGTLLSATGSAIIAILSYYMLQINPVVVFVAGFAGCHIDSLLGATLERRGYLTKSGVNLLATLSGGIIAFILVAL